MNRLYRLQGTINHNSSLEPETIKFLEASDNRQQQIPGARTRGFYKVVDGRIT